MVYDDMNVPIESLWFETRKVELSLWYVGAFCVVVEKGIRYRI